MPTTRKKVIKTVYKDDNDSEDLGGDFSYSGSDAKISPAPSSDEDGHEEMYPSSGDEFNQKSKKNSKPIRKKKAQFAKTFINKIKKQNSADNEEDDDLPASNFSVKDLTEANKLLPSFLNLSESDSSDDESPKPMVQNDVKTEVLPKSADLNFDDNNTNVEYKDVWSNNEKDASEEIAKKTFMELEQHKAKIEEAKMSILNYSSHNNDEHESDVKDLLAKGEEVEPEPKSVKKKRNKKAKDQSDSELDDWEEVKETKPIPQQGIQLIVDIPDYVSKKTKKVDVEMMMKRKMNKVKKEYQVYMHKVHVLCWLGHGNFVSTILNDQEVLSAALSLVPSKECYPGERVDMKYLEQITTWYKDKLTLKQDKHEGKFRPKALALKDILLQQIKNRTLTSKKYVVFVFVAMLRAIGLQCRVLFNFITVSIKPPASELHSLSTKEKEDNKNDKEADSKIKNTSSKKSTKKTISQLDGNYDFSSCSDSDYDNIMQLDGNDDAKTANTRSTRSTAKGNKKNVKHSEEVTDEGVSPPKRSKKNIKSEEKESDANITKKTLSLSRQRKRDNDEISINDKNYSTDKKGTPTKSSSLNLRSSRAKKIPNNEPRKEQNSDKQNPACNIVPKELPKIVVTTEKKEEITSSKFFVDEKTPVINNKLRLSRKRSLTANPRVSQETSKKDIPDKVTKSRAKSTPASDGNKSKYFKEDPHSHSENKMSKTRAKKVKKPVDIEDELRVSHKDLSKQKDKPKNDVTVDLMQIVKKRVKEAKTESKNKMVKGKATEESDDDSDYLPEEDTKRRKSGSDDDFKPVKSSPKPSTSRKIDRRVLSQDEEVATNRIDVWCEVFVEELEEWVAVDVIRSKVHCVNEIYSRATHPVTYVVGWDNNNYLKDLTRRYVPHWNTVTRKQRAEVDWWNTAVQLWLGPKTARDKEEDERLDRMQLEAPLPKSIAEYKNHPLYVLKRHLLKYEALYPPDAATLGFVRGEAVYARECVYVCRSRDTWLKEAKVVRLGEKPYKVVKARPKWDRLSNKLITDKPLEIFGPWQVKDYEPPVAENGVVPRNAYGNVELFKDCMLPKGTVHIKLPGLNRVAKKLNIDCAPAMTGFDFNGGWTHPVFEGFVVCKEFEEIISEAWLKDQEEQERKEREKIDARVYGNWRKLIKGLFIRERLKIKYGFEDPGTSQDNKKKAKGPRLVVKKTK